MTICQLYNPLYNFLSTSIFNPCWDTLKLDETPDLLFSKVERCIFSIFKDLTETDEKRILDSVQKKLSKILIYNSSNSIFSNTIKDYSLNDENCSDLGMPTIFKEFSSSQKPIHHEIPLDCTTQTCKDIDSSKVHKKAKKAAEIIYSRERYVNWAKSFFISPEFINVQEFLRFRKDDHREKFLYLVAEEDHNGASDPSNLASVLSKLAIKYDLKYSVISNPDQVCNILKESSETVGKISNILIQGHGNKYGVHISGSNTWYNYFSFNKITHHCFDGLKSNGKILLMSCSTGAELNGDSFDNVAYKIANLARRLVVAPTIKVAPAIADILSPNQGQMFYHPQGLRPIYTYLPYYNTNVFKLFSPEYKNCLTKQKANLREIEVVDAIVKELSDKSLLPFSKTFNAKKSYLGVCYDDPREKALYFSAKEDHNGALQMQYEMSMIGPLADQFDLQYRCIDSFEDLCANLDEAAKTGPVKILALHIHGSPEEGLIFSKNNNGVEKRLTINSDLSCFSKVAPDGSIVLLGGSAGQNASNPKNLAQRIANIAQRVVIAPTCPIFSSLITINSLDPLFLNHTGHSYLKNFFLFQCPENNNELFKTFIPQENP
jgi:hypothetical protein